MELYLTKHRLCLVSLTIPQRHERGLERIHFVKRVACFLRHPFLGPSHRCIAAVPQTGFPLEGPFLAVLET